MPNNNLTFFGRLNHLWNRNKFEADFFFIFFFGLCAHHLSLALICSGDSEKGNYMNMSRITFWTPAVVVLFAHNERRWQITCHMFRIIKTITGNSDYARASVQHTGSNHEHNFPNKFYLFIDSRAVCMRWRRHQRRWRQRSSNTKIRAWKNFAIFGV